MSSGPQDLDFFVCRREGHDPQVKLTLKPGSALIQSYVTVCRRCGKAIEIDPNVRAGDAE